MKLVPNFLLKLFQRKDEPVKYDAFYMNAYPLSKEQKELIKSTNRILTDNGIPTNKIKLVFETSFIYDVDKNRINPTYKQLVPKGKKHHVIEIGKPLNTMVVYLGENRTHNNYVLLKELARKSKKGIALLLDGNYEDVMWLANLDDAIAFYKESINTLDYTS